MNPIMHIEMTEGGVIDIELFPEITPNSVRSIIWLVNKGWYDNRIFYQRVSKKPFSFAAIFSWPASLG